VLHATVVTNISSLSKLASCSPDDIILILVSLLCALRGIGILILLHQFM
jgi:hypothetical protein